MPLLTSENIDEAVRVCMRARVPFAIYRSKGSENVYLFADDNTSEKISDNTFFVSPWNGERAIILDDRLSLDCLRDMPASDCRQDDACPDFEPSTPREYYLESLGALISRLKAEGGKTVISRIITKNAEIDIPAAAKICFERRKDATCCICTDADGEIWLIASPELLLNVDWASRKATTMSLAGTKPVESETPWDKKNIEEHDIVTSYIAERMRHLGTEVSVSDVFTRDSATVSHLCCMIQAGLCDGITGNMAAAYLSPTPAVCGVPVEKARRNISDIEKHLRGLYAGYFGVETPGKDFTAWVTLRCARLRKNGFCIYSGSGITAESNPEDEWNETAIKARPLVNILDRKSVSNYEQQR